MKEGYLTPHEKLVTRLKDGSHVTHQPKGPTTTHFVEPIASRSHN